MNIVNHSIFGSWLHFYLIGCGLAFFLQLFVCFAQNMPTRQSLIRAIKFGLFSWIDVILFCIQLGLFLILLFVAFVCAIFGLLG